MPSDILLYALIAAGLIFWLRNIIGTRDEDETPPQNQDHHAEFQDPLVNIMKKEENKQNVVALNAGIGHGFDLPPNVRIDSKTVENQLQSLTEQYETFDFNHFIGGVGFAFPMIIEAFAGGDRETLRDLLAPDVYNAFDRAIAEREARGEIIETSVKDIEKIDVLGADIKNDMILITLRFCAREICIIRNAAGEIISGDPNESTVMIDIWVFGQSVKEGSPEWYLYETRDAEEEEHKTSMPDAQDKDIQD